MGRSHRPFSLKRKSNLVIVGDARSELIYAATWRSDPEEVTVGFEPIPSERHTQLVDDNFSRRLNAKHQVNEPVALSDSDRAVSGKKGTH